MSFYRFARMEAENRTDLYVEGVMEAERPWWDENGEISCPENFRAGMEQAGDGQLVVHVNSPGGDLSAGIAIFEMLRQRKGKTRCEIIYAGSAATLIPCGCDESYISPAGMVMIHNPSMVAIGDEVEMEKALRAITAWKQCAIAAYQQRIKKSDEEIAALMTEEAFLNAQAAVELGLCDGVLEKAGAPAAMSYSRQAIMKAEQDSMARMAREQADQSEARERAEIMAWAKE